MPGRRAEYALSLMTRKLAPSGIRPLTTSPRLLPRLAVVLLLIGGSIPRFGCVCADGSHLPCCQRAVNEFVHSFSKLFADDQSACPCCAARHAAPSPCSPGSDSRVPCECEVVLVGPQWSSTERAECDQPTTSLDGMIGAFQDCQAGRMFSRRALELSGAPPGPFIQLSPRLMV